MNRSNGDNHHALVLCFPELILLFHILSTADDILTRNWLKKRCLGYFLVIKFPVKFTVLVHWCHIRQFILQYIHIYAPYNLYQYDHIGPKNQGSVRLCFFLFFIFLLLCLCLLEGLQSFWLCQFFFSLFHTVHFVPSVYFTQGFLSSLRKRSTWR